MFQVYSSKVNSCAYTSYTPPTGAGVSGYVVLNAASANAVQFSATISGPTAATSDFVALVIEPLGMRAPTPSLNELVFSTSLSASSSSFLRSAILVSFEAPSFPASFEIPVDGSAYCLPVSFSQVPRINDASDPLYSFSFEACASFPVIPLDPANRVYFALGLFFDSVPDNLSGYAMLRSNLTERIPLQPLKS